jgi:hypothetical protein
MAGTAKKLYRNPHFFAYDEDCTSVGRVSLRDATRGVNEMKWFRVLLAYWRRWSEVI